MLRFPRYKYVLLVLDLIFINLSFFVAVVVLKGLKSFNVYFSTPQFVFMFFYSFVLIFLFQWSGLYKINVFLTRIPHLLMVSKCILTWIFIYVLIGFLSKFYLAFDSRLAFVYFVGTLFFTLFAYRILVVPFVFKLFSNSRMIKRRALIVGGGELGKSVLGEICRKPWVGLEVVGFVDDYLEQGTHIFNGHKVVGKTSRIKELVKEKCVDEVIITVDNISHDRLIEIINECKSTNATVRVTSSIFKIIPTKIPSESYVSHPSVNLSRGIYGNVYLYYKRVLDVLISLGSLVILSPLFLLSAVLIKLTSKGPVFYIHDRVGKDGKVFRMYKFRTMYVGADKDEKRKKWMHDFIRNNKHPEENSKSKKIVDKSKITPVGKYLRKFKIDEFPQLINVLKGEMSIIGPRPVLPYEYEAYKSWHHERNKVLPGCTGFWQAYGKLNTSFDDMVMMDIYYINNMSPWFDLQIILKTVSVILFGNNGE